MIKEKLMDALKKAAEHYNGGMGANAAVAKAAEDADFNEKQAERLTEMFNTALAIDKERDKVDPAGTCELACKEAVAKILLDGCGQKKEASAVDPDYSFYSGVPEWTNGTIEARRKGRMSMMKAASAGDESVPDELNVSQRSLYKIIEGQIDMLKTASSAADDVVRNLKIEIEQESIKIAKAIESPFADPELADMFKAACNGENAVKCVSEYSTKVAESDGGRFSKMHVFDSTKVDELLKSAETIESDMAQIKEYERKRDFYMSKAAEAQEEMLEAVGLKKAGEEEHVGIADMFRGVQKKAGSGDEKVDADATKSDADICVKIAKLIRESDTSSESVAKLAEELEKDAAPRLLWNVSPSVEDTHEALTKFPGIDSENKRLLNVRRSILLADLMSNDPIIRDADPNVVAEAYKTMVMTSPRVSLDKSQVRAFLRSAVNSVAISPADAKIIADVDKGMSLSNIDRLTAMDSSIKDSNV